MAKRNLTLQDVITEAPASFWLKPGGYREKKHLRRIRACGTGAYGWTIIRCDGCRDETLKPRGCHNRNCPSCGTSQAMGWLERQEKKLLPTAYFHVVCTLPVELRPLALANPRVVYGAVMRAAKDTALQDAAARPAPFIPAITQVLHTCNQRLDYHPHVHLLVTGGGYQPDTDTWVPCPNEAFLAPGPELAARFRDNLLQALQAAKTLGKLTAGDDEAWDALIEGLKQNNWNVHVQPPFAGPKQTLRYLARYTHRTAISNRRIVALEDGNVTFTYLDRRKNLQKRRTMTVEAFLQLFMLHILPKGFHRIRGAGLLAPNSGARLKKAQAAAARHHGAEQPQHPEPTLSDGRPSPKPCACCQGTSFTLVASIVPDYQGGWLIYEHSSGCPPAASIRAALSAKRAA